MDVSLFFHSCVKTVLEYNKVIEQPCKASNVSKFRKKQHLFIIKTYIVTQQIAKLYELLVNNHVGYLNFSKYLSNNMSIPNIDCDKIDSIAENIISTCSKLIKDLKRETLSSDISQQNQEHCEIIILLIENYLKQICKIFIEQKTVRMKKRIEVKNISKLETVPIVREVFIQNNMSMLNIINTSKVNSCISKKKSLKSSEINDDVFGFSCNNEQLSAEDIQIFEVENKQLYNDLNILSEEIKQIENKVVQITELQDIFTEKILDQDKNLERILVTVVGSNENVRAANEQIRSAIQRNAGLRVWVLFFLLIMSLTLIFLDWYNP